MAANLTVPGRGQRPGALALAAAAWLIPSALILWGLFFLLGHLLTHQLKGSGVVHWDASVDRWFAGHRTATWNTVTHTATFGAETYTVVGIALIFFIALRLALKRWRASIFLAIAVAGEVAIFVCTTLVVDRARPAVPHLDEAPPTSSFPSGHTAAAVSLYGALAVLAWYASRRGWLRALATVIAVCAPAVVGLSRMYRGMHFPTDVIGGAVLGVLWLAAVGRVLLADRR